jgi:hypothetical protein
MIIFSPSSKLYKLYIRSNVMKQLLVIFVMTGEPNPDSQQMHTLACEMMAGL